MAAAVTTTASVGEVSGANETGQLGFYQENKEELRGVLDKEGSNFLNTRSDTGYVGLINQAATCYLNSLIQTLFTTRELRQCLYNFRHDQKLHGPAERSIPLQLQRLFAKLQFGARPATSTTELTRAFGWGKAQGAQQQDVQELCMVLFDALDRSLAAKDGAALSGIDSKKTTIRSRITDLFRGKCQNYIRGPKFCRYHPDPFLTLSLPIKGQASVVDALHKYFEPDQLNGDNQYFCEELDKKIDAEKGSVVESLPPVLMLHLKRFDFDFATMRRVKINDACAIPEVLDMDVVLEKFKYDRGSSARAPNDMSAAPDEKENQQKSGENDMPINETLPGPLAKKTFGRYELVSIMNHSGNSRGGHYRAFIRGDRSDNSADWFDFNDATVSKLDEKEVDSLFGRKGEELGRSSSNAYLLCYRKVDAVETPTGAPGGNDDRSMLPEGLQDSIRAENERFSRLRRTYDIRQQLVEMRVFTSGAIGTVKGADLMMDFPSYYTLERATQCVHKKLFDGQGDAVGIDRVRLRVFDAHASAAGKTFGGKESSTLKGLGMGLSATMMLEVREPDAVFEEYNPNEMLVRISHWDGASQSADVSTSKVVRVDGDQAATVGQLRQAIEKATGLTASAIRIIRMSNTKAVVLNEDVKEIKRDFSIWSGEEVILEPLTEEEQKEEGAFRSAKGSAIIKRYEDTRNRVSVNFNRIGEKTYDSVIIVDKRRPLRELKQMIADALGITKVNAFRLKLHERAPVLKDLDAPIGSNQISDGSVVYVEKGMQPGENEVILLFFKYRPNPPKGSKPFVAFSKINVDKNAKISDLKKRLSAHPKANGHPASRLRLRERKRAGNGVGSILRDDQTLSKCVKRISDGDKFAVQFLDQDEIVTTKDVIVSACSWDPKGGKLSNKAEIVLSKYVTVGQLNERMEALYPLGEGNSERRTFQVAKLRTMGGVTAKVIASRTLSGKGISWVNLETPVEREDGNKEEQNEASTDVLVMKTKVGRFCDGDNIVVASAAEVAGLRAFLAEKKAERERAAAIQSGENFAAASGAESPAPSKGNITKPRPPPTFAGRVVLKRPEVGIKISTVFDSGENPPPSE